MVHYVKIRENLISISNNLFLFKCTYIVLAFISFIPITRIYLGFLTKTILVWGAYLIINRFAIKRDFNKKSGVLLLLLLVISYCMTILLNYKSNFARNVLNVSYLSLNLLVVYGLQEKKKPEEYINEFKKINFLIIMLSLVMSLISIFMFIFLVKFKLTVDNLHVNQGFTYNRLYGVYSSANAAGMLAVVSITLTVINMFINKVNYNKKLHNIYIINIAVQTLYIILSDSRGAQVCAVSLFIAAVLLFYKQKFIGKRVNILKYIIIIILCAAVSAAGIALMVPTKQVLSYLPKFASNFIPSIKERMLLKDDYLIPHKNLTNLITKGPYFKSAVLELQNKKTTSPINTGSSSDSPNQKPNLNNEESSGNKSSSDADSVEVGRDSYEISGNRLTIWRAQFKIWQKSPVFGVASSIISTDKNKFDYINTLTNIDRSEIKRSNGNCHNGYLQLLVMGGALAFLLFAVFWIVLIKKSIHSILHSDLGQEHMHIIILTFAIVISLLINSIFESHIILRNADFIGVITWVYAGYLYTFHNSFKKSSKREVI